MPALVAQGEQVLIIRLDHHGGPLPAYKVRGGTLAKVDGDSLCDYHVGMSD